MGDRRVPAVVPRTVSSSRSRDPVRSVRGMSLPGLGTATGAASAVYRVVSLDARGRVSDRSVVAALGWCSGDRLEIRVRAGLVVVRACAEGVWSVTGQGFVRLPLAVRRWCAFATGQRVLAVALPEQRALVFLPLSVLEVLVRGHLASAVGGEFA